MRKQLQTTIEEAPPPRPILRFLEVAAMTLVLPAIGLWQRPQDPFYLHASYPWLSLAPLLVGLRYGFALGIGSGTALSLLLYAAFKTGHLGAASFPGDLVLGMLLAASLAGEFCDMWNRRIHRLTELNAYFQMRVQKFTRSYQLLTLSHQRLEGRLLANTRSLRESVTYLRERAILAGAKEPDAALAELYRLMMEVLSSFGQLQVAALYRVGENGTLIPKIEAKIGSPKPIPLDDPLLVQALHSKQLTCVRPEEPPSAQGEPSEPVVTSKLLLCVVPLVDVNDRILGVVAVQALPFDALSRDNLSLLAVIGGYLGDLLAQAAGGGAAQFHTSLLRCQHDARAHRLAAMLLGISVDPKLAPPTLLGELVEQHRSLDQHWMTSDAQGNPLLLLVMPLTDEEGAHAYEERLDALCQERHGRTLRELGVRCLPVVLDGRGQAEDKLRAVKAAG